MIGHPHDGNPALDVAIDLPWGPEFVSAPEMFEAEEAGDIFFTYYKTGELPPGYTSCPGRGVHRRRRLHRPSRSHTWMTRQHTSFGPP